MTILLLCALLLCGCGKQPEALDVLDAPENSPAAPQTQAAGAVASVQATAAYVFTGAQGDVLYGAVAYENTGDAPLCLTNVHFTFTGGDMQAERDFVPALASSDVLLPGERGYAAAWFTDTGFALGETALSARLTCESCPAARIPLSVEDIFLADNYPGFTTMTGTLTNASAENCAMNMVYVGFYDAQDNFLGVWYFSKNAQLDSMDSIRFATHMKSLPIPQLSQKAVSFGCRAFGFN